MFYGLFVLEDLESAVGFHSVFAEVKTADLFVIRAAESPELLQQEEDDRRADVSREGEPYYGS